MAKETAIIISALIILALPVTCVFAWAVDMSDHNLDVLAAIQTVIYVGWAIHCKINFKGQRGGRYLMLESVIHKAPKAPVIWKRQGR